MALVTDTLGCPDVACSLHDEIGAALASDESLNSTPVELLAKYAFVLAAGDIEEFYYSENLFKIAKRVLTASFPHSLSSTSRAAKKAWEEVQANWLCCIDEEAKGLVKGMGLQIDIIANALSESQSLSGDEIQQLLSRVCIQRKVA